MESIRNFLSCFYNALIDTIDHDGIEHAGYLAFLAILSIFPFLVFFAAIAGFFGQTEIGLKFGSFILDNDIIPPGILEAIKPRIGEIISGPPQGLVTVAILGAIWTASSTVEGLRTVLNRAYRVKTPPAYIWRRLTSIAQFLVLTVILIAVTFLLIIAPSIWATIKPMLSLENLVDYNFIISNPAWAYLRYFVTVVTIFLIVCSIYFIIPNIKQNFRSIAPGAALVVLFWFIAGGLFSGYLKNFDQVNIIYGSLGGLIAFLLFFYITSMILIFGAEFNYHLEKSLGRKLIQKEKA